MNSWSNNKVCANCEYFLNRMKTGQGIRCTFIKNKIGEPSVIPSFKYSCKNFKEKQNG